MGNGLTSSLHWSTSPNQIQSSSVHQRYDFGTPSWTIFHRHSLATHIAWTCFNILKQEQVELLARLKLWTKSFQYNVYVSAIFILQKDC